MAVVPAEQRCGGRGRGHEDGMASEDGAGKPGRYASGPRGIGKLISSVARPAFRSRSAAVAQLMADWPEVVGQALAVTTFPQRLAGGTLTLACSGPVALELQHLAGPLAERINAHFGRVVVERFRFVQADPAAAPLRPPVRRRPRPAPIDIPDMPDSELRDALAALGAAVQEQRRRRGH